MGSAEMVTGPLGNAEWDLVKWLFSGLVATPVRRRRLAMEVERESGVALPHQRFSRLLCSDEAFLLLKTGDEEGLGRHLSGGLYDEDRTPIVAQVVANAALTG